METRQAEGWAPFVLGKSIFWVERERERARISGIRNMCVVVLVKCRTLLEVNGPFHYFTSCAWWIPLPTRNAASFTGEYHDHNISEPSCGGALVCRGLVSILRCRTLLYVSDMMVSHHRSCRTHPSTPSPIPTCTCTGGIRTSIPSSKSNKCGVWKMELHTDNYNCSKILRVDVQYIVCHAVFRFGRSRRGNNKWVF